jgi:histidinol-phosphate aminotransferase
MTQRATPLPPVGENILRLVPYKPGKPIADVKRELGLTDVIKLASNENNLGPSPLAVAAMSDALSGVHLYPDGSCFELRQAVANHLDVPAGHLIFGNGSDDLIRLIGLAFLQPGDEIVQDDPTFSQYEAAAILNGAVCHKAPNLNWTHHLDAMAERVGSRTRIVFLTNPNNPTGTTVGAREVDAFIERLPSEILVVFDEAYFEYVERADYPDSLRYARDGRNVVVLRTFSTAYGLAGIRLGYGAARPEIIQVLEQVREPFNVSVLAQAAGIAALGDHEHLRRTREMNHAGKCAFYAAFDELGLRYAPSEANFVWVDAGRDSREVSDALMRRGVIVRAGAAFGAPNHLRVTIGLPEENERFIRELKEVLGR